MRELLSWRDLTGNECRLAIEAYEQSPFQVALGAMTPECDAPYWNRKHRYVARTIDTALTLLEAEIISVWERPRSGIGDGGLLLEDQARAAVAEHRNWWTYDPDELDDPEVGEARRAESAAWSGSYWYELLEGPRMRQLQGLDNDDRVHPLVRNHMRWWFAQ